MAEWMTGLVGNFEGNIWVSGESLFHKVIFTQIILAYRTAYTSDGYRQADQMRRAVRLSWTVQWCGCCTRERRASTGQFTADVDMSPSSKDPVLTLVAAPRMPRTPIWCLGGAERAVEIASSKQRGASLVSGRWYLNLDLSRISDK